MQRASIWPWMQQASTSARDLPWDSHTITLDKQKYNKLAPFKFFPHKYRQKVQQNKAEEKKKWIRCTFTIMSVLLFI